MLPKRANDVAYANDVASQMMLRAKPVNDVNRGKFKGLPREGAVEETETEGVTQHFLTTVYTFTRKYSAW